MLIKIGVLDKGFVALVSVSCDGKTLTSIEDEYYRKLINRQLWHLASMTVLVKCPLFQQLHFSKSDLRIIQLPPKSDDLEAYVPDVSEIHTGLSDDNKNIADYISATTESLLITPKTLQADKCDPFVSQVITPVSAYNEILVHGSLNSWIDYIKQKRLPKQIEAYRSVIEGIMIAEWKELDTYKKG